MNGLLKPGSRYASKILKKIFVSALRGAPQPLIDAVLGQIVAGPREMVREAIESPTPRHKMLEARSKVIAQAQALAARGLISFGRQDASSELI